MTVKWIVLLRSNEGSQQIAVEADVAVQSDDGKTIEFSNLEPLRDIIETIQAESSKWTTDQWKVEFLRLLRSIGRMSVASFRADAVDGYFQAADLDGG